MFGSGYREIEESTNGIVFNIEHFHVHDGEGIRTNVFLKGCNLHCPWCCNPESINPKPQIAYYEKLCTGCGKCQSVCPHQCIEIAEDGRCRTDRSKCTACGACEKVCPHAARELFGHRMSVSEVMAEVEKDSFYFMNSDGGMTLSGGETCLQPEFARSLIEAAHRRYIPVALETAGAVKWESLWKVAELADEILFDLKTTETEQFAQVGNVFLKKVLNNLHNLTMNGKIITVRCPIVPNFNDTAEHLENVAQIATNFGIKKIDLLPFHQLGRHKYEAIGQAYRLKEYPEMDRDRVEEMAEYLRKRRFQVSVGG